MAKTRKSVKIGNKIYERLANGRYQNVENHDDTISRRQAEKGDLIQSGYKSFEQKVKARKQANIPKGFREKRYSHLKDVKYYRKTVHSLGELLSTLVNIPDDNLAMVVATYTGLYPIEDEETGRERLKKFNGNMAISSLSRPSVLLDRDFVGIYDDMLAKNRQIKSFTIQFRPFPKTTGKKKK